MKYTQGNWKVDSSNNVLPSILIESDNKDKTPIAMVSVARKPTEEMVHNALIISAAPKMYEALLLIRRHGLIENEGYENAVKVLNEAIWYAETNGQSYDSGCENIKKV